MVYFADYPGDWAVVAAAAVGVEVAADSPEVLDGPIGEENVGAFVERFADCVVAGSTASWHGAMGEDAGTPAEAPR